MKTCNTDNILNLIVEISIIKRLYHFTLMDTASVMLTLSVVDRGFEPQFGQIKDYKIDICCFTAKHAAIRRKKWLVQNQDNVPEWGDMSICGLLFQ